MGETVGQGAYGTVKKVYNTSDGATYAMKVSGGMLCMSHRMSCHVHGNMYVSLVMYMERGMYAMDVHVCM